jgi:hypothetical protein
MTGPTTKSQKLPNHSIGAKKLDTLDVIQMIEGMYSHIACNAVKGYNFIACCTEASKNNVETGDVSQACLFPYILQVTQ